MCQPSRQNSIEQLGFGTNPSLDPGTRNRFFLYRLACAKPVEFLIFRGKKLFSPFISGILLKILKPHSLGNPREPEKPQEIPPKSQRNPARLGARRSCLLPCGRSTDGEVYAS